MGWFAKLLSGGILKSVENIALEAIDTDKETAEAKSLFVKTLDPNGMMRRQISLHTSRLYAFYLIATVILIFMVSFGIGDTGGAEKAIEAMKELFVPITTAWATIVGASFGVNGMNTFKGN